VSASGRLAPAVADSAGAGAVRRTVRSRRRGSAIGPGRWRRRLTPYLFLTPNLLVFTTFLFIPIGAAIFISFQKRGILDDGEWIGLKNYVDMTQDPLFWQSLGHTIAFTLGTVPTSMALGLLLAVMLNRRLPGRALLRSIYFIPVVIAGVIVALIWAWIFDTTNGVLNGFLAKLHVAPVPWTSSQTFAMLSLVIATVWVRLGFCMVVYLAGLQSIPGSLHEAARVDGARGWSTFWHVTWPLLGPTTFLLVIINVIFSFQVFDLIYVMTGGGPGFSTTVFVEYIYRAAFMQFQMGYASALGVVLFLVCLAFTAVQWRLSRQGETAGPY
jgi:multiple sugar transport system permease protein